MDREAPLLKRSSNEEEDGIIIDSPSLNFKETKSQLSEF